MDKAIIFDADGVIFDNEGFWDEGQKIFLARRGLTYNRSLTKHHLTGRSLKEGVEIMQQHYGFPGDPALLGEERMEIMRAIYHEVDLMPGFLDFYRSVKERFKTAVATSSNLELFKILDNKFNITGLFNGHVYFLHDVGNISKPAPDLFLYASKKLECSPKDTVVIEDSPLGIEAAKRAHMKCIAIASSYPKHLLEGADQVVDRFDQMNLQLIFQA